MMNEILENALIAGLAGRFPRSPLQYNGLQESDAELIRLPGTDVLLAVTADTIVEEIEAGLYADPYLIGWMTVIASASDLAAVGAEPLGILLSETLPRDAGGEFTASLQNGIRDACLACGLPVLGGDTNLSSRLAMSGCALGLVSDGRPITRVGCRPGDLLFATGRFGGGSAYAFVRFVLARKGHNLSFPYQPQPRLREGQLVRRFASCAMDTSDGLLTTLDQLMRLNSVGFVVEAGPEEFLDPYTLRLSGQAKVAPWIPLAGPHGEFELVFAVPPPQVDPLLARASADGWTPVMLGKVVAEPGISLLLAGEATRLDTGRIRNLFDHCDGNVDEYFSGLLSLQMELEEGGRTDAS